MPIYRTGNNAYAVQSIAAQGGVGSSAANTAGAIFGLQRVGDAFTTGRFQKHLFDPARYLGADEPTSGVAFLDDFNRPNAAVGATGWS